MIGLFSAVLVASLFGSLHCVGMCGPLAILAGRRTDCGKGRWSSIGAYHSGRFFAYGILGGIAGCLGASLQGAGEWFGLQRLAAQFAGGSMLVIGLFGLVQLAGGTSHAAWLPNWLHTRLYHGHQWARRQPPVPRAFAIGLLTAILPCGWLFSFLLVAAGTARPIEGSLVMILFALGSVPALSGVAAMAGVTLGSMALLGPARRAIPWFSAILISVVGFYTMAQRANADLSRLPPAEDATIHGLIERVQAIDRDVLPCCTSESEEAPWSDLRLKVR